jgi:hypothetical protein
MHASEPSIEELKKIKHELTTAEKTPANAKKLAALLKQIDRRQKGQK